ncbi:MULTISPECIES: RidA family protein [unclassified Rhizobium]|uniref:RidA family protein n=1 Tax=unclassified Rhizobium TaxID=2613769 RepID=UPI001ADD0D6F|nr:MULTISPECIES: RidA family protein [unclassified Rhizobium]MBO9099324.1 RidA family protein [Rhizobium sp. L58/93]MBO9131870.1 RidA family protein [Rhizobium sp. B209b/85]MBO9169587.1 RidA family protein [Rhizobium sp. L245/93]MBO9185537.1 RidA family protein [Rhizobium sp. E27B/91]QXZ85665.1 RidA family protein [Rhizobium sp. K1/93]
MHTILQPEGWAKPIGYANGVAATGRTVFVGGQIGWNAACEFESDDFVDQVRQTLSNIVAILAEGGAGPQHITSMTWYFTDKAEYLANLKGVGQAYRDIIGRHFPAMAAVQVVGLVEDRAKIEIQATAVVPE